MDKTVGQPLRYFATSERVYGTSGPSVIILDEWIHGGKLTEPAVFNISITVEGG